MSNKLLRHLPDYYRKSTVMTNVTDTQNEEIDIFIQQVKSTLNQFFVDTADSTLERWERELGIPTSNKKPIDYRRGVIKGKLIGQGTFTMAKAKDLANSYSKDNTAEYINIPEEYAFKTRHDVDDLISLAGLGKSFEESKPAHLEHITGLITRIPMAPDLDDIHMTIQISTDMYNEEFQYKVIYRLNAMMLGYSELNPETIGERYTNGAGLMDGAYTLAGKNHKNMMYYLKHANDFKEKIKQNIYTPINLYHNKNEKLQIIMSYDSGPTYEKQEHMNTGVDLLGFTEYNPDKLNIDYTNGASNLDGSRELDGENEEGVDYYVRVAEDSKEKIKQTIEIPMDVSHGKNEKIHITMSYDADLTYSKEEHINAGVELLGFTEYNPDKLNIDYTNGASNLDGSRELDGENEEGVDYYVRVAEDSKEKIKQTIEIPMDVSHDKNEKIHITMPYDTGLTYSKEQHLNTGVELLGFTEYNPDKLNIDYTNGASNLEGTRELNGENEESVDYYLRVADELTIKTYKNNSLIKTETIRR